MTLTEKCIHCNKAIIIEITGRDAEDFIKEGIFVDVIECNNCGKENRIIIEGEIKITIKE